MIYPYKIKIVTIYKNFFSNHDFINYISLSRNLISAPRLFGSGSATLQESDNQED
jgi:hypothetical protein